MEYFLEIDFAIETNAKKSWHLDPTFDLPGVIFKCMKKIQNNIINNNL